MSTQRKVATLVVLTGVSACTDPGRLPMDHEGVQVSASASAVQAVACSTSALIAAIEAANNAAETTLHLAAGCVYRLTQPNNISPVTGINSLPVIRSNLTINGGGATIERFGESSDSRLLYVLNTSAPDAPEQGQGSLVLNDVTLRGGSYSNSGGALFVNGATVTIRNSSIIGNRSGDDGGGVHNFMGTLTLENSIIRNNNAADNGGGISNYQGTVIVAANSRIEGNHAGDSGGLFNDGGTVTVVGSRISDNGAEDQGGGVLNFGEGGRVTISGSVISGNRAADSGGGLANFGLSVTVLNSTIMNNYASDSGGGIANESGADLVVSGTTLSGNEAGEDGGGIYNLGGTATVSGSTVSGNTAKFGGGVGNESGSGVINGQLVAAGRLTVLNSTISGNSAREGGGGIYGDKGSNLTVQYSTVTGNTAQAKGGGGVLLYNNLYAETRIRGTIVSGNAPHDVAAIERKSGTCCSEGHNLIGTAGPYIDLGADFGRTGDLRNVTNPRLGPLADNGGPTRTHAPIATSPASLALDGGGSACPAVDQRGVARPAPPAVCDIGAFELVATTQAPQTITFHQPASPQGFGTTFTVAPTASSGLPVQLSAGGSCSATGYSVTMTSPAGDCTLTASQGGSADFAPAPPVIRTVAAQKGTQSIQFTSTPPGTPAVGGVYAPTASGGGSGNPVTFGASGACSYHSGSGLVSLSMTGTCTVTADQAGNDNFLAAPQAQQQFLVQASSEIEFRSAANAQNGSATTLRINRPAGVVAGDFLLAHITFEKGSSAGSDVQITPPGWTLVRRTNNGSDMGQAVFSRAASASEPTSYTWTFAQSVKAAGGILVYTGVRTASPIVASSGSTGSSSTLTATSVNAESNGMLVALFGFKKKDVTLSAPAGMIGRYSFQNPNDLTIRATDERRTSWPATTGNRASTAQLNGSSVSDKWVAQLVLLRAY